MSASSSIKSRSSASSPDPDTTPIAISRYELCVAAVQLSEALNKLGFEHVFLGGFQMATMDATRETNNVDVEVKKSLLGGGLGKIAEGLAAYRTFIALQPDEALPLSIRVQHRRTRAVMNIFLRGASHLFKKADIVELNLGNGYKLPCLSPTALFIEKVRCAGVRFKRVDGFDVVWLHQNKCVGMPLPRAARAHRFAGSRI